MFSYHVCCACFLSVDLFFGVGEASRSHLCSCAATISAIRNAVIRYLAAGMTHCSRNASICTFRFIRMPEFNCLVCRLRCKREKIRHHWVTSTTDMCAGFNVAGVTSVLYITYIHYVARAVQTVFFSELTGSTKQHCTEAYRWLAHAIRTFLVSGCMR